MSTTVTRTFTGSIRLRDAREHRGLEHLWWWANQVRNALCEQELGLRAHNRRVFLSHGSGWEPGPEDFTTVLDETPGDRLIARPRRNTLGRQWTQVTHEAREHPGGELDATRFGRRVVNGIFEDYCRRYEGERIPPPKFRSGWKLGSVCVHEARLSWRGNRRDAVLRVQGLPALRVRLHRPVPEGATVLGTVRIVRRQRGCRTRCPTRYELRVTVQQQAREPGGADKALGWDPGGRRALTSSEGHVVRMKPRDRGTLRRLQRKVARCTKGSRGWYRAKGAVRVHQERETRAREQHRRKQVAHVARKADVHVVETNRHASMRRKGGKAKSRMNRSFAHAGPSKTVTQLRQACERLGKIFIEAPAPYNSRTCASCESRDTRLTRSRIVCRTCGRNEDRDENAAANALKWARTQGAVPAPGGHNPEVSARRGNTPAPRCPVPPKSLGSAAPLRGGGHASSQVGYGNEKRQDICPCRKPEDVCPNGQISC